MFGSLGFPELILIFFVALIVFGPRRLPEIGRSIGKALGEFKRASEELKSSIEREVQVEELKALAPTITAPLTPTVSRTEPVPVVATVVPEAPQVPAATPATATSVNATPHVDA